MFSSRLLPAGALLLIHADAPAAVEDENGPAYGWLMNNTKAMIHNPVSGSAILDLLNYDGSPASHAACLEALGLLWQSPHPGDQFVRIEAVPDWKGDDLVARYKTSKGRLVQRTVGRVGNADQTPDHPLAKRICELHEVMPGKLADDTDQVHFQSVVDGQPILLDAGDREVFEASTWKIVKQQRAKFSAWPIPPDEIVDNKTGRRLADILVGADGHNARGIPEDAFDLRRHRIRLADRRTTVTLRVAPEMVDAIEKGTFDAGNLLTKAFFDGR